MKIKRSSITKYFNSINKKCKLTIRIKNIYKNSTIAITNIYNLDIIKFINSYKC